MSHDVSEASEASTRLKIGSSSSLTTHENDDSGTDQQKTYDVYDNSLEGINLKGIFKV